MKPVLRNRFLGKNDYCVRLIKKMIVEQGNLSEA